MANQQENGKQLAGVIGYFDDPHLLVEATKKVKEAKYKDFDAFSPYPVHGLDQAQGLSRSPLPFITMAAGITGCSLGFLLQYWTSAVDWPLIIGGKPFNSWPAFVPVMFECTILFAGLSTVGGMFILNGLPNITKKAFDPRLTRDRFALLIEAPSFDDEDASEEKSRLQKQGYRLFNESEAADLLRKTGAKEVKSVYAEGWF